MRKWYLSIGLFALFVSLSFSLSSNSAFAVSDITQNFDQTVTSYSLCNNSDTTLPDCTDYNFLYVETDWTTWYSQSRDIQIRFSNSSSWWSFYFNLAIPQLFDFSNYNVVAIRLTGNQSGVGSGDTYNGTITLSENNPMAQCPEPEPCPAIPDNPYDTKFDDVVQAIYVVGAIMLVIYFFYCIYRLIIKSVGGI